IAGVAPWHHPAGGKDACRILLRNLQYMRERQPCSITVKRFDIFWYSKVYSDIAWRIAHLHRDSDIHSVVLAEKYQVEVKKRTQIDVPL
ncbi:MAG: hypothetical protein ACJ8AG_30595, partial [Ktedonobacteraceae bacterium]